MNMVTTGISTTTLRPRGLLRRALLLGAAVLLLAGCSNGDPGALGPNSVDGGLSTEGQKQEYVDGVSRALNQLGKAQDDSFGKAVEDGSKKGLQAAALDWRQGGQQLKQLNPPKDAAAAHAKLISAVDQLAVWNARLVAAAPNKAQTRKLAKQASISEPSTAYGDAVCELLDKGYSVVESSACTPLSDAGAAGQ
jgi:hypothetical protein